LEFRVQANCDTDYTKFPSDRQTCCFSQQSLLYGDLIKFSLLSNKGQVDLDELQSNWVIENVSLKKEVPDEDPDSELLRLCLVVTRKSSTLNIEMYLPMIVSAVVLIASPLFGTFQQQLYVKLFALLLQFICFQFLVNKTPHVGFGDNVPIIYKFYEFTVAMTLTNIIVTIIIVAMARVHRSLPPPHSAVLFANTFNTRICCIMERTRSADTETQMQNNVNEKIANGAAHVDGADYTRDWHDLFVCLNNFLALLLSLIYIIGLLVFCAL